LHKGESVFEKDFIFSLQNKKSVMAVLTSINIFGSNYIAAALALVLVLSGIVVWKKNQHGLKIINFKKH